MNRTLAEIDDDGSSLSDRQKKLMALTISKSDRRLEGFDMRIQLRQDFSRLEQSLIDETKTIVAHSSTIVAEMNNISRYNRAWDAPELLPRPESLYGDSKSRSTSLFGIGNEEADEITDENASSPSSSTKVVQGSNLITASPKSPDSLPEGWYDDLMAEKVNMYEEEEEDFVHETMAMMGGKWSKLSMGEEREEAIREWAARKLQALYRGRKARDRVRKILADSRRFDSRAYQRHITISGLSKTRLDRAATRIQSLWRGVLATSKVYHVWLQAEETEQVKAATSVQSMFRMNRAKKKIERAKKVKAMDLSWDTLATAGTSGGGGATAAAAEAKENEMKPPETTKEKIRRFKKETHEKNNLPQEERTYGNLEKLNAKLRHANVGRHETTPLRSERLDLGLAYWEQPLLAPEVLSAMQWDEDLVQANPEDDAFDDPDTAIVFADADSQAFANAKRTSVFRNNIENNIARVDLADETHFGLGVVEPRTIGTMDDNSDDSSSSSDDDEEKGSDADSSDEDVDAVGPLFEKFEAEWRGVRKSIPPPAPGIMFVHDRRVALVGEDYTSGKKGAAGATTLSAGIQTTVTSPSKDAENIARSRIVDVEYLPKFLQKTPLFRRAMGSTAEKGDGLPAGEGTDRLDGGGNAQYSVRVSFMNDVKKRQEEIRKEKAILHAKRERAAIRVQSMWRKRKGQFAVFLLRRALKEEDMTLEQHTKIMAERKKWESAVIHIVGLEVANQAAAGVGGGGGRSRR